MTPRRRAGRVPLDVLRAASLVLVRAGYSRAQVTDLLADVDPVEADQLTAELLDEASRHLARNGFTYSGVQNALAALRNGLPPTRAPAADEADDQLALFS